MISIAVRSVRANLGRFALGLMAIAVAVAFVVASQLATGALRARLVAFDLTAPAQATGTIAGPGRLPASTPIGQSAVGITGSRVALLSDPVPTSPAGSAGAPFGSDAALVVADPRMVDVVAGALPSSPDEVLLGSRLARLAGLEVGSRAAVTAADGQPRAVQVSGIGEPTFGRDDVVATTAAGVQELTGNLGWSHLVTFGPDPQDDRALGQVLALAPGAEFRPAAEADGSTGALDALLLTLSLVVAVAGVFVIGNTFAAAAAARSQEVALLRTIGATASQIQRAALVEALMVGLLGTLLGLAAGTGIGFLASGAIQTPSLPGPATLAAAAALGIGVAVLGALGPARAASRTAPMAALAGAQAAPIASPPAARAALTIPLGLVLLLVVQVPLVGSVLGGLVGFSLLVAAGPWIAPRLGARLLPGHAVASRLARGNIARSPRRSARTTAALVLGVSLATASTAMASAMGNLGQLEDSARVSVVAPTVSTELAGQLGGVTGVERVRGLGTSMAELEVGPGATVTDVRRGAAKVIAAWPQARLAGPADYAAANPFGRAIATVLGLVAGIALLIGVIGVLNTVLLGVRERAGELTMLRVLGLTRWQLRRMVLLEAGGLAAIGVVLGLLLGGLTVYGTLGPLSLILVPFISWWLVALVPVVTVGVAVVGALVPAERLARRSIAPGTGGQ